MDLFNRWRSGSVEIVYFSRKQISDFGGSPRWTAIGHLGIEKTYARATTSYYWPGVFRDVVRYIIACDTCQRTKVSQQVPLGFTGRRVVYQPRALVSMDCMGPHTRSRAGNKYIIVFHNYFSKWIQCKSLRATYANNVGVALEDLILSRWGKSEISIRITKPSVSIISWQR